MLPVGGEAGGRCRVRLLDKAGDREHARRIVQGGADLDISVAGLRRGRAHAECHDAPGVCRHRCRCEAAAKQCGIDDHMVGGQHPQDRVRVVFRDQNRRRRDRRRAVASNRLQHDAGIPDAHGAELFGDQEPVLLVAHDYRRGEAVAMCPQRRLLQQGAVGHEWPELLGEALARDRPQPGAGAAGQDDGDDAVFAHRAECALIGMDSPQSRYRLWGQRVGFLGYRRANACLPPSTASVTLPRLNMTGSSQDAGRNRILRGVRLRTARPCGAGLDTRKVANCSDCRAQVWWGRLRDHGGRQACLLKEGERPVPDRRGSA